MNPNPVLHTRALIRMTAGLALAAFAIKAWLASQLALFGDEAFYWVESQYPDWGYSDVPLLTPWLVGLGDQWLGGHFGPRAIFVVMGSTIPWAVYWLALPLTGKRHALVSALAATALPLLSSLGILALPDVPLVLISTLTLGQAVRASRQANLAPWLKLGLLMGLGFLTHYRFVLIPLALLLASLGDGKSRQAWRTTGPWLAMGLAFAGLWPALWFNLQHQFTALGFHFARRHPWHFQAAGLNYPILQTLAVSPGMMLALLVAFLPLRQAARQDTGARMLWWTALLYIGTFGVLAPWADQRSTSIHWPQTGYIPLLVYLPVAAQSWKHGRTWLFLALASGWLAVLAGLTWCLAMTRLDQLPYGAGRYITDNMAGWPAVGQWSQRFPEPLLVDDYYLAAQLAFERQQVTGIHTFEDDKTHRDGRIPQLRLWGWQLDEGPSWPATGTLILEANLYAPAEWKTVRDTLCQRYPGIYQIDELEQFHKRRHLIALVTGAPPETPDVFCDTALQGWLDVVPKPDSTHSGTITFAGWYTHPSGVSRISLAVDGNPVAWATPGLARKDVLEQLGPQADPHMPDVGFQLDWDSHAITDGWHSLSIEVSSGNGHRHIAYQAWIRTRNGTY